MSLSAKPPDLIAQLQGWALELGFSQIGVADIDLSHAEQGLRDWLQAGFHGDMAYMARHGMTRARPAELVPGTVSVVCVRMDYLPPDGDCGWLERESRRLGQDEQAVVSVYARGRDYHKVIEDRLFELISWMRTESAESFEAAHFVDKHQVQERVYAHHAGVGWIGKNSCVINPELGSWMFLSGIAVSLELEPDAPAVDQCGSCTLCIDACPTGALVDARELDATKCISYLTIETERDIPPDRRAMIGNHAWGCDICQDVCPWNLGAAVSADPAWSGPQRDGLSASWLWQQSDDELHARIKGSAMTYVPLSRLRRNLATIIGNTGDAAVVAALDRPGRALKNAARSAETPAVADAIDWARRGCGERRDESDADER